MTHELILTSVSQGLEPDSRGFCVVAENRGIPQQLVKRLTNLSEYRHVYEADTEDARWNPVVYSHMVVWALDKSWHVLSRIADSGTDYRHQPNRLAHHIAIRDDERVPEGPAWVLSQPGFHFSEWQTPSVRFAMGRPLPTLTGPSLSTRMERILRERNWIAPIHRNCRPLSDTGTFEFSSSGSSSNSTIIRPKEDLHRSPASTAPCPNWFALTGDSGWGGVLAETVRTGQQVVLLFEPGMNLLPLYLESLALLPPALQWRATFSTYYTKLPDHVSCQWKGVLADSPEAKQLLATPHQLILDLTSPLGSAPPGPYVEFARHGNDAAIPEQEEVGPAFVEKTVPADEVDDKAEEFETKDLPPSAIPMENDVPEPKIEPSVPPVIAPQPIRIHAATPKKTDLLGSFLNMESRGRFYFLYGTTFFFVLCLSALVLDQFLDFGLARWIRGVQQAAVKPPAPSPKKLKEDEKKKAERQARLDEDKIAFEKLKKENEIKRKEQEEKKLARERQAAFKKAQQEFQAKSEKDIDALNLYLLDHPLPDFLPLQPPNQPGAKIAAQTFKQLAPLHAFGSAVELNLISLLDLPRLRIETRKNEFFLEWTEPKSDAAEVNKPVAQNEAGKDGKTTKTAPAQNESTPVKEPAVGEEPVRVPDMNRFEWTVFGIDKATGDELPLFRLKLTAEGLLFDWLEDALKPQLFQDALWTTLGFLRVGVKGEKDLSRIQSIPLFQPMIAKPVLPAGNFTDPSKPFEIATPLAKEPWKSLFETTAIPYRLMLKVKISPETLPGIQGIEYPEPESSARFLADFQTEISSKRSSGGSDTFSPIAITLEGSAEPSRILWSDRYPDQVKQLQDELEKGKVHLDEMKKEEESVRKQIFNAEAGKAPAELRKRRNELNSEIKTQESRIKEIEDILEKIPSAHEKLIKSEPLRVDYSVFLIPDHLPVHEDKDVNESLDDHFGDVKKESKIKDETLLAEKDDSEKEKPVKPMGGEDEIVETKKKVENESFDAEHDVPVRLRSEESLLLMTTEKK